MDSRVTDKYSIEKELGKGAFGTVYLAKHRQLGEFKAIKELRPQTQIEKKRVKREIYLLQQAQHPHVIKIDEIFKSEKVTYICMEYAEKGSLEEKLNTSIPKVQSIQIALDILKGVQSLHARGIVHRDLKPGNILFDSNGKAKIGDFGIAKASMNISRLTKTGKALGTIGYMAPEQLLGKKNEINEQSDVYAVGVMLYEMLVGEHPLRGENQIETVNRALQERYKVPMEQLNIEKGLREVCYKAIKKSKSDRYQSAGEMIEDLNMYSSQGNYERKVSGISLKKISIGLMGLLGGIIVLGMSKGVVGKYSIEHQLKENKREVKELLEGHEQKENFRIIGKEIQRNIYNGLQQGSENNITENVLRGEELYKLGVIYYEGKGIKKDYKVARNYFEQASEFNLLEAYVKLGEIYLNGKGVDKNKSRAIEYYRLLEVKNDVRGYYNLGEIYIQNKVDKEKGVRYLEKSAALGHKKSIERLVQVYIDSNNFRSLKSILKRGIEERNDYCFKKLGTSLVLGQYGFKKNEEKGLTYLKKAILYGNIEAVEFLLENTIVSNERKKVITKEIFNFLKKRKEKDREIAHLMGYIYLKGIGTEKDYKKAKKFLEKGIDFGNTDAITNLASMYEKGIGVERNYQKARKLYEKAIELNNTHAMVNYGLLYTRGFGVEQNLLEAKKLYERAAELGNIHAISNLGVLYERGHGVEQSYAKARELYVQAAKMRNHIALNNLGNIYRKGYGVEVDYDKAKKLFEESAKLGNPTGMNNLAIVYHYGQGVQKDYSKAKELYEKAIELGSTTADSSLGLMYYNGHGVEKDYVKAKEFYEKAIKFGDIHAMNNLGLMYEKGNGVEKDYKKARELYEKSMVLGNTYSIGNLGFIYENGFGVEKNYIKAKKLYEQAIVFGNSHAMYRLGSMYMNAQGVRQDYVKARRLYEQASEAGDHRAMNMLGKIYENGHGVEINYEKAKKYYNDAALLGNQSARNKLRNFEKEMK